MGSDLLLAVLALLRRAAHELLAILVGRLLDGRVSESLIVGLSPRVVALERSEALSFELRLLLSRNMTPPSLCEGGLSWSLVLHAFVLSRGAWCCFE